MSTNSPVVAEEISKLKSQSGMDILVAGSCQLVDMLMQNKLIDEYLKGALESLKFILKPHDSEGKEG